MMSDLLANQSIAGLRVKGHGRRLQFGRAQLERQYSATSALVLGKCEHTSTDSSSSSRWIDIHSSQLHAAGCPLKAEHAHDLLFPDSHPKASIPLSVVRADPIDFIGQ